MVNASDSLIRHNIGNDIASNLAVRSITIEQNSVSILNASDAHVGSINHTIIMLLTQLSGAL